MTTDTTQPWYPASWLDADGKPLPDVHEVTPGEWPPCKPTEVVDVLYRTARDHRIHGILAGIAGAFNWASGRYVAIRIIERAA